MRAVAPSPDGQYTLSGSWDNTLPWWDLHTGECLYVLTGHNGGVTAVALSVDGRHALSGSSDRTLRWWDLHAGRSLAVFPCEYPVYAAALSQSPTNLVVVSLSNGSVLFFQIEAT